MRLFVIILILELLIKNCCSKNDEQPHGMSIFTLERKLNFQASAGGRIFHGSVVSESKVESDSLNQKNFGFVVLTLYFSEENPNNQIGVCSGTLLSSKFVLTAAHCFMNDETVDPTRVIVVAGNSNLYTYVKKRTIISIYMDIKEEEMDLQERRARRIVLHPSYDPTSRRGDIAVITVSKPFQITQKVWPISLSENKMNSRKLCTIMGWGRSERKNKQVGILRIGNAIYAKSVDEGCQYNKTGPFICLEYSRQKVCFGDSGGPLVCEDLVFGVASHILGFHRDIQCGDDYEQYYTEVYPYLSWIHDELSNRNFNSGSILYRSFILVIVTTTIASLNSLNMAVL